MISSWRWGATVTIAETTRWSAISKIGVPASALTAMIVFDDCIPARGWIAPARNRERDESGPRTRQAPPGK